MPRTRVSPYGVSKAVPRTLLAMKENASAGRFRRRRRRKKTKRKLKSGRGLKFCKIDNNADPTASWAMILTSWAIHWRRWQLKTDFTSNRNLTSFNPSNIMIQISSHLHILALDKYSRRKYFEVRIESYETRRLNTQINHMFQPNREAPSFASPPSFRIFHIA